MLEVSELAVRYGAIRAVHDVSLQAGKGELIAILGANGAGKSSTLKCIAGALKASAGTIRLDDQDVTSAKPEQMVRLGVAMVPETRRVSDLTVSENLTLGSYIIAGTVRTSSRPRRCSVISAAARRARRRPAPCRVASSDAGDRPRSDVAPSCSCSTSRRLALRPLSSTRSSR